MEELKDYGKKLPTKVKKFIQKAQEKSKTRPTIEQIRWIVKPFLRIITSPVENFLHVFQSPMRFGKTQTIWRMIIPMWHQITGGKITFIFTSSVSEVVKSKKWHHKNKVGGFDYYVDQDENNLVVFSSETTTGGMGKSWKSFCDTEAKKFDDSDYKNYTLTIVMLTGFAKTILQDKSKYLDKMIKSSKAGAPLLLWDECGINLLPHNKLASDVFGNGADESTHANKKNQVKFANVLYDFKQKYNSVVLCFSATLNALHHGALKPLYSQPFYTGEDKREKLKKRNKKFTKKMKKYVKVPFRVEDDTKVNDEDSRYTTSVLEDMLSYVEDDFSKVLEKCMFDLMSLNLWNRENYEKCGFSQPSPDRNMMVAVGNDNSNSGMEAITYIEFYVAIGIITSTLDKFNKSVSENLQINPNRICLSLQEGTYLLSDIDDRNVSLTDEQVEQKCNDGSILMLIVKNKFQTGFDCSNFYRTILCKQGIQAVNERHGAEINVQKPAQSAGRGAGTHSGLKNVFGWKGMKTVISELTQMEDEETAYKVLEWFVKNNSFAGYIMKDKENKFHTAPATIDYLKKSYPSSKKDFMDYLWDARWETDMAVDSVLQEQILSNPVPEELKIHSSSADCPCPNCSLKKGHEAA